MNEKQEKLIKLLEDMFQLNQTDLDFGIYRIMNQLDHMDLIIMEHLYQLKIQAVKI